MAHFDVLIVGGSMVDGTGSAARPADIGIAGGRIAAVAAPGQLAATWSLAWLAVVTCLLSIRTMLTYMFPSFSRPIWVVCYMTYLFV